MEHRSVFRRRLRVAPVLLVLLIGGLVLASTSRLSGQTSGTGWKIVAWNNLGMHCMDADFSVFAILPPYNTIQAQLIDPNGKLVTNPAGFSVTYQGVKDPSGSVNTTSGPVATLAQPKTDFWSFVKWLFGAQLPVDTGLLDHNMPGSHNLAQPMIWDSALNWFIAEGIPITPYDDAGNKNYYPLMHVSATDGTGATLASTDIVLPVSDEMDCAACHASGSGDAAKPAAGWQYDSDRQRDYRFNILRLHDERQMSNPGSAVYTTYIGALKTKGYDSQGLYATAKAGTSILCAACHKSEALSGSGLSGIPPLTASMHSLHSKVIDPTNGLSLDSTANRSACYRCHPGSETRCLRGVMGNAVAPDGTMAIQCQNCHGLMSAVGDGSRTGWLQEPTCQSCHTGTAAQNSGSIRFSSVFDSTGKPRTAANDTFATSANTPATGYSLYRFSAGHGGLQCSACHGSTHAEYPSSHRNDNLQSVALQGHVGTIAECGTCHATVPATANGGPHGMHPVGSTWVSGHHSDSLNINVTSCQACHGTDYRGTVLSRAFAARTLTSGYGTKQLFRGAQIGCYMCHNGPGSESANPNRPPVASNLSASSSGAAVAVHLAASDPDGNNLTLRVVSQPANGTVGLSGTTATYYPYPGFTGTDTFTYAAWDGSIDSNLATVTVSVAGPPCSIAVAAGAPSTATINVPVSFTGSATASNCSGTVTYDWDFGDGTPHATVPSPSHTYTAAAQRTWTFTASIGGVPASKSGTIVVESGTTSPPPVSAPAITNVVAQSGQFRIEIDGSGFEQGVKVFIANDTTPWKSTQLVSSNQIVLSGGGLSKLFPKGVDVPITVVNPDGGSASKTFRR